MTCKIAGCDGEEHKARLCLSHYDMWKLSGILPGPVERKPAMTPHERALAREQGKRELQTARALMRSADALADAAHALPDVLKSRELRRALSDYRAARREIIEHDTARDS